jgi:predicted transcriptional regulator
LGYDPEAGASPKLAPAPVFSYVEGMEVPFTAGQEAQLARMATKSGTDAPHLVKDAALRLLDEEARFLSAIEKGIAAAECGEFIEEEEMDARIERMFKP